jgi:integrase
MADDTLEKIAKVEATDTPYIDGKVLATALKLAYFTGMQRKEIFGLKINDILDSKGNVVPEIQSCAKTVKGTVLRLNLTGQVIIILRDYLTYLKKNDYPIDRTAPLFPQKKRTETKPYDKRKINRDLNEIDPSVSFKSVRRAGLERIFHQQQVDHFDRDLRYRRTAEFARTGIHNIKKMRGEYRITGTRYSSDDGDGNDIGPIFPDFGPADDEF